MATGNFIYENRCIVVTNEDYDNDNIPQLGEIRKDFGWQSSQNLKISENFSFWDIIITAGYYEHACIDYTEKNRDIEYWIGNTNYYATKTELFNECKAQFGLTDYRLRKVCGNVNECSCIEIWLERAYERLTEYLREQEEIKVNEYLDKLKKGYGYDEYVIEARFSNGETIYKKIS